VIPAIGAACLLGASGCKSGRAGGGGGLFSRAGGSSGAPRLGDVSGHYIVSICDADTPATALADSKLGEHDPKAVDALTVLALPIREPETPWAQISVSNSVVGPPDALAVSGDGKTAVVIESRGPASAAMTTAVL